MKKDNKSIWYDNGNIITNLIIIAILLIIFSSQSFANNTAFSFTLIGSVINHNSIYLFVLIYFILLKFSFGKSYFNYLNLLLIFLYGLTTITSLLTLVGAFSLNTVLEFTINFVLCAYLFHTMLRGTRLWKELRLTNSPFNEFTNDGSFYIVVILSVFILIVELISTVELRGVVLSILDAAYLVLLGRYIFLYRKYLDDNKIDFVNEGNFDEVRKTIDTSIDTVKDKTNELLDKTDIDEKIVEATSKVVDTVKDKTNELLDKTDIDEKVVEKVTKKKKTTKKTTKSTTKKKGEKK